MLPNFGFIHLAYAVCPKKFTAIHNVIHEQTAYAFYLKMKTGRQGTSGLNVPINIPIHHGIHNDNRHRKRKGQILPIDVQYFPVVRG